MKKEITDWILEIFKNKFKPDRPIQILIIMTPEETYQANVFDTMGNFIVFYNGNEKSFGKSKVNDVAEHNFVASIDDAINDLLELIIKYKNADWCNGDFLLYVNEEFWNKRLEE